MDRLIKRLKRKRKIFIIVGGCTRRGLDASKLANYFRLNNCKIVRSPKNADFIIIVTCSYKQSIIDNQIKTIKNLMNHNGEIIVLGCLPGIAPVKLSKVFNGKTLSTKNINNIDNFFPKFEVKYRDVDDTNKVYPSFNYLFESIYKKRIQRKFLYPIFNPWNIFRYFKQITKIRGIKKKRAVLRIAYGCNGHCSYCAIPLATGRQISKPIKDIINEYKKLLKEGYLLFGLNSEDTGSYGVDIGKNFKELITAMSKIDKGFKVKWQIQTLSPNYAIKYRQTLINLIKQDKINYIKCDLQSGNQRILKLMNRYSDIHSMVDIYNDFNGAKKGIFTFSQFIVGFPSETDKEFQDTINIMKRLDLSMYQLFPYSDMENIVSYKMGNKVSDQEIKNRLKYAIESLKDRYESHTSKHFVMFIKLIDKDKPQKI